MQKTSFFCEKKINETTGVDKEKADFLFELKNTINKGKITKKLERFFVEVVSISHRFIR